MQKAGIRANLLTAQLSKVVGPTSVGVGPCQVVTVQARGVAGQDEGSDHGAVGLDACDEMGDAVTDQSVGDDPIRFGGAAGEKGKAHARAELGGM